MRITFEDGSFMQIMDDDVEKIELIMCAYKNYNQVTMASSKISAEQVEKIIEFLSAWLKKT